MIRVDDDLDELKALLTERLEEVAEAIIGQPSAESRRTKEWRFLGHGGCFLVVRGRKRGAFYSFANSAGGSPLDLIMYGRSCSFAEAVHWAREFLGLASHIGPIVVNEGARAERLRKRAETQRQAEAEKAAKDQNGTAYARSIWNQAEGLSGTAAEAYLVQARSIPMPASGWPHEAIRYHAASRALILAARDDAGDVQAIQRVYLTPAGQKIDQAEMEARKLPAVKVTSGPTAGAAVRLPGVTDGPLLLAEGPETGLSVWAGAGAETWIALGSMGKLELPDGRQVIACADDDKADKPAAKALAKAMSRWRGTRRKVSIVTPWAVRRFDKSDFNDLLRAAGPEAVAARVAAAISPPRPDNRKPRVAIKEGRRLLRQALDTFFLQTRGFDPAADLEDAPLPIVHGIRVGVGVGKSAVARFLAAVMLVEMRARGDKRTLVFAVPTHKLGDEQAREFEALPAARAAGLRAGVWRGREAPDPAAAGETMCRDLDAVRDAQSVGAKVETSVCFQRGGGIIPTVCPFYGSCGYQRQKHVEADLWFVPHEMIFAEKPAALGKIAVLVVDEAAWQDGLQGVNGPPDDLSTHALDVVLEVLPGDKTGHSTARLREVHRVVAETLAGLKDGPLQRDALLQQGLDRSTATDGRVLTWRRVVDPGLRPGMMPAERREKVRAVKENRTTIRLARFFAALEALLDNGGPEASGWASLVTLQTDDGPVRALRLRGRRQIRKGWTVPTLILDALLDARLVAPYWPQIEVTAEIEVETPHMRIRQLVGRDFSKASMVPDTWRENTPEEIRRRAKNCAAVRAAMLREARAAGGRSLVVAQKAVEDQWKAEGAPFPAKVDLAHHNAVAGRDEWGPGPERAGVALLAAIGRTLPQPGDVERMAEAVTGRAVSTRCQRYERHEAPIEMQDGDAATGEAFRHPDPIAEAIRWQVCEGELLQIIGRARGVNRTTANPVDVLVLTDIPLPVPVDELVAWDRMEPSMADLMLSAGGVVLENHGDIATAYPGLWPTREAAKKAAQRERLGTFPHRELLKGECPQPPCRVTYRRAGAGCSPAVALVDLKAEPDPRAWLTDRLGPLAACDAFETGPDARPVSSVNIGSNTDLRPTEPDIDAVKDQPLVTTLHPPLPGEDLRQPSRPPPTQVGLLGVIPGRCAVQIDPYPEPGSYEPDEEDLLPVPPGTPLPDEASRAWWFELQRRKAAVPPPDMSIGWPANHFRKERWKKALNEIEAAWNIEWQAAWIGGSRLPPAEEGTTT